MPYGRGESEHAAMQRSPHAYRREPRVGPELGTEGLFGSEERKAQFARAECSLSTSKRHVKTAVKAVRQLPTLVLLVQLTVSRLTVCTQLGGAGFHRLRVPWPNR